MSEQAIVLNELTKHYGKHYAPTATTKRELKSVIIQYLKIFRYTVRSANGK